MKPIVLLSMMLVASGCQSDKPPSADAALPVSETAPPEEGPRSACPQGTELRGSPDQLQEWCQLPDGSLQGRSTIWHQNHRKAAEGNYQQNRKQGLWTYWHPNGQEASRGEYQNGKRQGPWSFFYENGKPSEKGRFQDGLEQGLWISYNPNGDKIAEIEYKDGMQRHRKNEPGDE